MSLKKKLLSLLAALCAASSIGCVGPLVEVPTAHVGKVMTSSGLVAGEPLRFQSDRTGPRRGVGPADGRGDDLVHAQGPSESGIRRARYLLDCLRGGASESYFRTPDAEAAGRAHLDHRF